MLLSETRQPTDLRHVRQHNRHTQRDLRSVSNSRSCHFRPSQIERLPNQHKITALVHQKKVQDIAPGSARTRIMRSSMKIPEAKTWVICSPSTGYATYIPHHYFKVWLQYYCQVPLFQPRTRCQRPQCAAVMGTCGDHLLYCERGPHRIRRHYSQVKLLARDLATAARHSVVEERPVGRHMERPDIRALGRSGGTELFDVTI